MARHSLPLTVYKQQVVIERKGRKYALKPRKMLKNVCLPKPTGKPQPLCLSSSSQAQPCLQGPPQHILDSASGAYAASVSLSSQSSYKTALGHLEKAEAIYGSQFSSPPTNQQLVFFTSYLAQRKVASATIKSYLSAVRFISLSRGDARPTKLPNLGAQIVAGVANIRKDVLTEASKPKRRPITIKMLMLIKHAIASNQSWNELEKCLRWSCMLTAFWGSFHMSELIQSMFHPSYSLLPSDIKFHGDSVALWIRSPKVWRDGGDVVEVWEVKDNEDIDPVLALKRYT